MTKITQQNDKELYQCEECGFHYKDQEWAEKCEAWCKEHHSCNIEITSHAAENKIVPQKTSDENPAGGQKEKGCGGRNFCPTTHRAEDAVGVGAAPLSYSVKRSKAKHFSNPFRRKRVAR